MLYQFNDFELDSANFCLNKDGQNVEIEPQVFNLIAYLVENRNRLVTRDEIFEQLWADRKVLDATLSNHIKNARSILGDDGQSQKIIKTVRGRGYQFVSEINTNSTGEAPSLSLNRKFLIPLLSLSILLLFLFMFLNEFNSRTEFPTAIEIDTAQKSIAILPFENRSNIDTDLFFTDGIHDDLLTRITKIRALRTISRTSVMAYRNTQKNLKLIAKELGVTTILEGGVQRAGNEIRINVQLINAQTDKHIWAESYTRELTSENIFAIQTEISNEIAKQLKIELVQEKEEVPTQNMAALEAYFHAQFSSDLLTREGKLTAMGYLKDAVKLDPNFSLPYAILALIELERVFWDGQSASTQIPKAEILINKALSINESSSEAYSALALLKILGEDFEAAEIYYNKATSLEPNNISALTAHADFHLLESKDYTKAIFLLKRATDISPKDDSLAYVLAKAYISAGEYQKSKIILNRILKSNPKFAQVFRSLSDIAFYSHYDYADSIKLLYHYMELDPGVSGTPKLIALTYLHTGDTQQTINWLEYSLKLTKNSKRSKQTQAYLFIAQEKYNHAFDLYLDLSDSSKTFKRALFKLATLGKKTNRMREVMDKFKEVTPVLFKMNVPINQSNYISAFALGKLIKNSDSSQSKYLLQESLRIAQQKEKKGWFGKHYAWEAKILTAMGRFDEALDRLKDLEEYGYASKLLINDPDFFELRNRAEFKLILNKMNIRLDFERKKLRQMESDGMLYIPKN